MTDPRWSILLPTHNRADTLALAIESVLRQTQGDFELLVVGDGCTDNSAEVVQGVGDKRIQWFDLPKAPHFGYANRNVALQRARGKYIAYIAHDDLWTVDHLDILDTGLANPAIELAYTQSIWITPEGMVFPISFNLEDSECLSLFLKKKLNTIPMGCFGHRRSVFERCGYWDAELPGCGDWDMWVRIIYSGQDKNFAYIPLATNLHFRANWKTEENEGPNEMKVLREFFAETKGIPEALSLEIPEGASEQKVFYNRMLEDPNFIHDLRQSIEVLRDQRLWRSSEEVLALKTENETLKAQNAFFESQHDELKKSVSWYQEKHEELLKDLEFLKRELTKNSD